MKNFIIYNGQSSEDKRIRKTKYFIQTALLGLLEQKKIQEISVSELAEKADVNRKTFYNHYSTPEDVLKELEEKLVDTLFSYLDSDKTSFLNNPRSFFKQLALEIMENRDFCMLLTHSGEIRYLMQKTRDHFIQYMSEIVSSRYIVDAKYFSFLLDYIINGLSALVENWLFHMDSLTPDEFADLLSMLVSATLSTLPEKQDLQPVMKK